MESIGIHRLTFSCFSVNLFIDVVPAFTAATALVPEGYLRLYAFQVPKLLSFSRFSRFNRYFTLSSSAGNFALINVFRLQEMDTKNMPEYCRYITLAPHMPSYHSDSVCVIVSLISSKFLISSFYLLLFCHSVCIY